jgi:hypothetical protein
MRDIELLCDAVRAAHPDTGFSLDGDDLTTLVFNSDVQADVSAIEAQYASLLAAYTQAEYQRQRAAEYPPITDYLDGVVKGDQDQIDAYIAACQAVKAKYPKGA